MAHRILLDTQGIEWQVWAVVPTVALREMGVHLSESHAALDHEMRDGWLAFQAHVERRRLVPIPAGWDTVTDDELRELLSRAASVANRRRLVE
jgi:hypothetical protein